MKHIVIRRERLGYSLDPRPYLDLLPDLAEALPPGAAAFAGADGHYHFGDRCPKDLWIDQLSLDGNSGKATLRCTAGSDGQHARLTLVYAEVASLVVVRARDPVVGWLGSVLLDEILPNAVGMSHEIALTGGTISLEAADLDAQWA